jgi:hypothetical protein
VPSTLIGLTLPVRVTEHECIVYGVALHEMLIPAIVNGHSGHREHRFRASRSLIGAKRRRQLAS